MTDLPQHDSAALESLLASLQPADRMRAFYQARLGRVWQYDQEHHSELERTLDAYFAAGRSLSGTAQRLKTHRNTVLYRLRRIEELVDGSLRDPHLGLELQVALRIRAALAD
jgi:PucR family transcriptional regulator, purine catabolism regulatory protein